MKRLLVALLALLFASPAFANHASFRLINHTGKDIVDIVAGLADKPDFRIDLLKRKVMKNRSSAVFNPEHLGKDCTFKVDISFSDGTGRSDIRDLCTRKQWTIR